MLETFWKILVLTLRSMFIWLHDTIPAAFSGALWAADIWTGWPEYYSNLLESTGCAMHCCYLTKSDFCNWLQNGEIFLKRYFDEHNFGHMISLLLVDSDFLFRFALGFFTLTKVHFSSRSIRRYFSRPLDGARELLWIFKNCRHLYLLLKRNDHSCHTGHVAVSHFSKW